MSLNRKASLSTFQFVERISSLTFYPFLNCPHEMETVFVRGTKASLFLGGIRAHRIHQIDLVRLPRDPEDNQEKSQTGLTEVESMRVTLTFFKCD